MDNPEYTERQINTQLAKRSPRGIRVLWDGDIVDAESVPAFDVYVGDTYSQYMVLDHDTSFDVQERLGRKRYAAVGWASGYHKVADLLVDVIEEAIAEGRLKVEED